VKIVSDKSKDYVTVRREFHQLGEQEHDDKYYTQEIAERLGRVRRGTAPLEQASTPRRVASERLSRKGKSRVSSSARAAIAVGSKPGPGSSRAFTASAASQRSTSYNSPCLTMC
jgi:hypothetical protein